MRLYWDDDAERALLAQRLGYDDDASNTDLAASFQAWFDGRPTPGRRPLTVADLEHIASVVDDRPTVDARNVGYSDQTYFRG